MYARGVIPSAAASARAASENLLAAPFGLPELGLGPPRGIVWFFDLLSKMFDI